MTLLTPSSVVLILGHSSPISRLFSSKRRESLGRICLRLSLLWAALTMKLTKLSSESLSTLDAVGADGYVFLGVIIPTHSEDTTSTGSSSTSTPTTNLLSGPPSSALH